MGANEKVGERHVRKRYVGLRDPPTPVLPVCRGTDIGCRRRHIEDFNAPTAYSVGDRRRVCVTDANLGQAYRIDGGTVTCHAARDRLFCPTAKRRPRVKGVDEHVGVQKDHGSRVSWRSLSQVIVDRRGALRMASIDAFLVIRTARSGFSRRISTKRPSVCCWISKTSPGWPLCNTMRFFESTMDMLMVGLSHIAYLGQR